MRRIVPVIIIALIVLGACRVDILPETLLEAVDRVSREIGEQPTEIDPHQDAPQPFAWVDYPSGIVTFVFNGVDWDTYPGKAYVVWMDLTGE